MIEQGTDEWRQQRAGKVTASRIADVMATTKSGYGASRATYMAELLVERLSGQPVDGFTNAAMQWGTDQEPHAREAYEFITLNDVEQVGFIDHPTIAMAGASPDGQIGADGLVEIKCPNSATHIATLRGAEIDGKYLKQMQWQMACTGRDWCDFVSFDPRLPDEMQIHIRRVQRDPAMIVEMETAVRTFLAEVDEELADLRARYMKEAA